MAVSHGTPAVVLIVHANAEDSDIVDYVLQTYRIGTLCQYPNGKATGGANAYLRLNGEATFHNIRSLPIPSDGSDRDSLGQGRQ